VNAALAAALDIHARCAVANASRPPERALHAAIGIGFGDTLYIGEEDLHGDEMNVACSWVKISQSAAKCCSPLRPTNLCRQAA